MARHSPWTSCKAKVRVKWCTMTLQLPQCAPPAVLVAQQCALCAQHTPPHAERKILLRLLACGRWKLSACRCASFLMFVFLVSAVAQGVCVCVCWPPCMMSETPNAVYDSDWLQTATLMSFVCRSALSATMSKACRLGCPRSREAVHQCLQARCGSLYVSLTTFSSALPGWQLA